MCDTIFSNQLTNFSENNEILLSSKLRVVLDNKFKTSTPIKAYDNIDDNVKRESLRILAIEEILTSEISYLEQLEKIIKYFMVPIKCSNHLTLSDYSAMFGSIETIYSVNGELLSELKSSIDNVACAFIKLAPFFKLYSVYAYDYKKSMCILQEAQMNNSEFKKFLQKQEIRPEVQTKLPALLIAPIQRIPRYRLLLKQVIDYTLPNDPNYRKLLHSLKEIEQTADHINNLVEEQENVEKMLKLQQSLVNDHPCIIKPGRKLVKEGMLMKMSRKGNRGFPRYFVLMNDILMYCKVIKQNPKAQNSLECCCIFPLNKCNVNQIFRKGVFKISCQDEVILLYTDCQKDAETWVEVLNETIQTYLESRKTLRKDSSARRPARKRRVLDYEQNGLSPGIRRQKRKIQTSDDFDDVYHTKAYESADSADDSQCFPHIKRLRVDSFSMHLPFKISESRENIAVYESNLTLNQPKDTQETTFNIRNFLSKIKSSVTNLFNFK